jgi:hypothetical protein
MRCMKCLVAVAALGAQVLFFADCAHRRAGRPPDRKVVAKYSLWDGMGRPNTDPQFAAVGCLGTLTISNIDVRFEPGTAPGCSTAMHQRTMGTLGYPEVREIRVTPRPEVLIFKTGTTPPALRVTDWKGAEQFQRVVGDLTNAYQAWKSQQTSEMKLNDFRLATPTPPFGTRSAARGTTSRLVLGPAQLYLQSVR